MNFLPTSFPRIAFSLVILFIVAMGCTTKLRYPGPQLPYEKVAKLKGTYNFYYFVDVECIIVAVDGESVYGGIWSSGDTVEILPGKHEVSIGLIYMGLNTLKFGQFQTFSFVAEAGHVYKADGNWNSGDNQIWIIDKESGQVVAGEKP